MKAILMSFNPEHAMNILNGDKTLELRKRAPKEFKGWIYGYVTKRETRLNRFTSNGNVGYVLGDYGLGVYGKLNGTIPFRFWYDEHIEYGYDEDDGFYFTKRLEDFSVNAFEVLKALCLTRDEFHVYGKGKDLYVLNLKNIEIFDKPKRLGEFKRYTFLNAPYDLRKLKEKETINKQKWDVKCILTHAPQSWQYVEVKE